MVNFLAASRRRRFSLPWVLSVVVTVFAGDNCGRSAPLPTSPSSSAPGARLTYSYAPAITGDLVETAVPEAVGNLESSMDWTLDHDVRLEILDSPGPPTATGGNQTITIHGRNPGWTHVSPARRKATIAHELFHLFQQAEGIVGPVWMREGAAEFFGFHSAFVMAGTHTRSQILECNIALALLQDMPPLASLDTANEEFPYSYATIGIHFLLNGDSIGKLNRLRTGGIHSFGRSQEEFYARFDEYQRTWQNTTDATCL